MTRSRMSFASIAVGLSLVGGCSAPAPEEQAAAAAATTSEVEVPDLVGNTMDTVRAQLDDARLEASAATLQGDSDWTSEAVVLSTDPVAGTRVRPGATVKIVEATKAEVVFFSKPMPKLVGREWLKILDGDAAAGYWFTEATWRAPKSGEKAGTIVAQQPAPGTKLTFGQPLRVTVADHEQGEDAGGGGTVPKVDLPNVCRRTKWC